MPVTTLRGGCSDAGAEAARTQARMLLGRGGRCCSGVGMCEQELGRGFTTKRYCGASALLGDNQKPGK